jgi:hypothetical protein
LTLKPLYSLYKKFEENIASNRYRKFLNIRTQKTIDGEKSRRRVKESSKIDILMRPKDKKLERLERLEKEE